MKSYLINSLILLCLLIFSCDSSKEQVKYDPAPIFESVDPFIGTGGHGHTFPGATLPFGMVQLSPDTRIEGWDGCSGYHYSDSVVYGFSHTHLSGTGVSDYGDILFSPNTTIHKVNGEEMTESFTRTHGTHFDKQSEEASPGYYKAYLDGEEITVELTSSLHCGVHRYTTAQDKAIQLVVDLSYRDLSEKVKFDLVSENEIQGLRVSRAWAEEQHLYFVAQFSRPFTLGNVVTGKKGPEDELLLFLNFQADPQPLEVKVGISAVDIDGARKNLEAELAASPSDFVFDKVKEQAVDAWMDQLSRIKVKGGTTKDQRNFYSALYHTHIAPNIFTDVDGRYRGMDMKIHNTNGKQRQFSVFSLWDTFRATHPLYTILHPEETGEFIKTFLRHYQEGGRLPVWELAGNETDCMIGYHSVPVIVDAYMKGIVSSDKEIAGFDSQELLEAMIGSAEASRGGLSSYIPKGFIEASDEPESVSKTLEYAYDDWCIAVFADHIGEEEIAKKYYKRSQNYQNLFDPETGFFRSRMNGGWQEPFDPSEVNFNFTEANAWQYSCFVPQDIPQLIDLHGGKEAFYDHLDKLFSASTETTGRDQADITGLIGQYAHGNEPSHHMAYLYAFTGEPAKGASRIREIMDNLYQDQPDGLSGNEDCGQMSAWFVFSSMGFYPVCPGSDQYVLGSPLFPEVSIELGGNRSFDIMANGLSEKNIYIQSATLNGESLKRLYLRHGEIAGGGKLVLEMGDNPDVVWWDELPGEDFAGERVASAPIISAGAMTFTDQLEVVLSSSHAGKITYQKSSDLEPVTQEGPITLVLTDTDTITAWEVAENGAESSRAQASYYKIDDLLKITSLSEYANQYAADGGQSLVDQLRGGPNFQTGRWQGFREALEVEIDLGEERSFQRLSLSCLQDIKSWIWMPRSVRFSVSLDGEKWKEMGMAGPSTANDVYGVFLEELVIQKSGKARFVKVIADQFGVCPPWHLGAGGATWIFADEVIVE